MARSKGQSSITVVENVYFRERRGNPVSIPTRHHRRLNTEEQHFERWFWAKEEWQPLPVGWLTGKVGHLVLRNVPEHFERNPTPAEREAADAKVVEVSYDKDSERAWLIPPGSSMRAQPSIASKLWVRCQSGEAECELYLIPD